MEAWSKEEGGALGNPESSRTAPERLSAGGGSEAAPASWRALRCGTWKRGAERCEFIRAGEMAHSVRRTVRQARSVRALAGGGGPVGRKAELRLRAPLRGVGETQRGLCARGLGPGFAGG